MKHLIALPFLFSACLVPFEMGPLHKAQAAAASPSGAPSLAMSPSDCESLDRERVILSSIAAGLGAVGGGAAIPLPITDDKVGRTAEAITIVVSAVGALVLGAIASKDAVKFTAQCTQ